jgi:hypothetical protein
MSYLDLPRLHFGGLFFTAPGTINNHTKNYTPSVPLQDSDNKYNPKAGWDPMGVAQLWLEECTVLSAVGTSAQPVGASDAVIGAAVETPSPKTPMSNNQGGFYDIAKMVDLDPDQQGRSAVYGVRIAITLPNGAGLQGSMTVPELRQLNPRVPIKGVGSWTVVGNWMGALQDVVWRGDLSSSPFLIALKAASAAGLAVKLTVDLHQNNPANTSTAGDMFCYGRVLGSIGPAFSFELAQVLPGRCLQQVSTSQTRALAAASEPAADELLQARERVSAQSAALADLIGPAVAQPAPWNPAVAVIRESGSQTVLSIDIGASILLAVTGTTADGTFTVNSGITVGVVDSANQFTPFTHGALSFVSPNQYQPLASTLKNCVLVRNSGVFTFPLTADEFSDAGNSPLAIQVNGITVVQENPSGLWMDVSVSSQRLECGTSQPGQAQLMVRKFGEPVVNQAPPVTVTEQLFKWTLQDGVWKSGMSTSTDLGIEIGVTDANGLATITTTANVPSVTLPHRRQPLDSQVYYIWLIDSSDPDQDPIGDGGPTISVLLWNAFQAPSNPSWNDVGLIFGAYARLYPGMKAIFDISNQQKVVGFAPAILSRMSAPVSDPAYMPVTRDLSPSKMKMIVSWLASLVQQPGGTGSGGSGPQ